MTHLSPEITGTLSALEQYSFSDEAAQLIRKQYPNLTMLHAAKIGDVWNNVIENESYGIIPFENSSGGVVWPHLDRLMREATPLQIIAAVHLEVRMCVGGKQGTTLENAQKVYSHPKGIEQCATFLHSLHAQTVEASSTVNGVQKAKEDAIPSVALASRAALEAHGLTILGEDVADLKGAENVTNFFVIRKNGDETLPRPEAEYHSVIIIPHNTQGVIADILQEIKKRKVDLLSLHSRSIGRKRYAFYIEMHRQGSNKMMQNLATTLNESSFIESVKWLGSWDTQVTNDPLDAYKV